MKLKAGMYYYQNDTTAMQLIHLFRVTLRNMIEITNDIATYGFLFLSPDLYSHSVTIATTQCE